MTIAIPADVGRRHRRAGYWTDEWLLDYVSRAVRETPDKQAVVDEQGGYTYSELWDVARSLTGWLAANGVARGDTVSVQLPNWREFAAVHLAAEMLGAVTNPLLPMYRAHELRHILDACHSRVLVVPQVHRSFDGFVEMAGELAAELPSLNGILVVRPHDKVPAPAVSWAEATSTAPAPMAAPVGGDDPVIVTFSSGTESLPKGCVHSHNTTLYALREGAVRFGLGRPDIVFMPSPLGHTTGFQWGIRMAWYLGTTLVLQDQWNAAVAADLITTHRCSYSLAATPFVQELVEQARTSPVRYDFSCLRMFVCGGAPIPRELVRAARAELAGCELLACYGTSETYILSQVGIADDEATKKSDGRPLPGVELRAVGPDGRDAAPGGEGECWTRGPHVMLGYLNPPPGKVPYTPGDWMGVGDYISIDESSRVRVVGRLKDIIIRGGLNISPLEVEDALRGCPSVAKVAVVGYADERLGERACAVVVPRGEPPALKDLTAFLKQSGVATYKWPEKLLLVDELPMTASGKVQKFKLREFARTHPGAPGDVISTVVTPH